MESSKKVMKDTHPIEALVESEVVGTGSVAKAPKKSSLSSMY